MLMVMNLAMIVVTFVFRFNSIGNLTSMSLAPTKYDASIADIYMSDERTYATDAKMIVWIVAFQIVFFLLNGFTIVY